MAEFCFGPFVKFDKDSVGQLFFNSFQKYSFMPGSSQIFLGFKWNTNRQGCASARKFANICEFVSEICEFDLKN